MIQVNLLPYAFPELFAHASSTGCLTLADRYGLMAALLEEHLPQDYLDAINRLLRAVSQGRIAIVD